VNTSIQWQLWSRDQILSTLPSLIDLIESQLDKIPAEHREKDSTAIRAIRTAPPTYADLESGQRGRDLVTIALSLDVLGRTAAKEGKYDEALHLFQSAHELLRGGEPSTRPTQFMRQSIVNAMRVWTRQLLDLVRSSEIDAGQVREKLRGFVISAWGSVPESLELEINEMIFSGLEHLRTGFGSDSESQENLVRNNIESLLSMEIPSRLESLRQQWEDIGQYVAPAAVRGAQRILKRPDKLSRVLNSQAWEELRGSVSQGDSTKLLAVLSNNRDAIEANLRLRLDAKPDYREPNAVIKFKLGPDRFFEEAKSLLLAGDRRALEKFRDIHYRKSTNTFAKEWYAYALIRFGDEGDKWDIIDLLQETIGSEFFRSDVQWTARWNLACALRRVPDRADEALDVLLPVLESDAHTAEVFELCLLWSVEQDRDELLESLLVKSRFYEAHLLAALREAEHAEENAEAVSLQAQFQTLNRIVKDPDRSFPDPKDEQLEGRELERLTKDFIESSLEQAGLEWFRQRIAYGSQSWNYVNWKCAATLHERMGDKSAAYRCLEQQWRCSRRSKNPDARKRLFMMILNWSMKNDSEDDAARLLKKDWQLAGLGESEMLLWDERLRKRGKPGTSEKTSPTRVQASRVPQSTELGDNPDRLIQELAPRFVNVPDVQSLVRQSADAQRLIAAAKAKRPEISDELVNRLQDCLRLVGDFYQGVTEEQAEALGQKLSEERTALTGQKDKIPYELVSLAQSVDRISQNVLVRARTGSQLTISTPADLGMFVGGSRDSEAAITTLLARVSNDGPESAKNLQVVFFSTSHSVKFPNQPVQVSELNSQSRAIVECKAEIDQAVEEKIDVTVHLTCEMSGIARTFKKSGAVRVHSTWQLIPTDLRYVTTAPVGIERSDLFHGRERELRELAQAFEGGRLRTLYFVNGIRRVGKSTLMKHLGAHCGSEVASFLLNIEEALSGQKMNSTQLVRQLIRACIQQARTRPDFAGMGLRLPEASAFELDPPWVVFEDFLRAFQTQAKISNVLVCFDELPLLVKSVADKSDPMDDGCLAWIRKLAQEQSDILVVCTGSEPYETMRSRYREHTVWGNLRKYDVSFVDRTAMEKIVTSPVIKDKVTWLPEALDHMWQMTEGHPWITQLLAAEVSSQLNREHRRLVGPADVDRAADIVSTPLVTELWWNETREGLLTATHRQIAYLILHQQLGARDGAPESQIFESCQRSGVRNPGRYLEEMKLLEVVTEFKKTSEPEPHWRIRGAFLERYLSAQMNRAINDAQSRKTPLHVAQPAALMLDVENIKIRMTKMSDELPENKAIILRDRLKGDDLAIRLLRAAARHGEPRQKWAVADWERPIFAGDQKAFRAAGFKVDISGQDKENGSDHVLKEHIHFVLREHPQIDTFIIGTGDGDFNETIETLKDNQKRVVLWASRKAINTVYGAYLRRPDAIVIEWLEDLLLDESDRATQAAAS
jgi:NYN domain-containing protein